MSNLYPDLNLTLFPENVDTFVQWLNITASDGPLIKQYSEAMQAGNTVLANQILAQIPSGTQKIIKANDLNKLTQSVLAMERLYNSDISPYIEQKQMEWRAIVDRFEYKGVWSNATTYEQTNLVSYTQFGMEFMYIATKDVPVGTPVTNSVYWRVFTIQGLPGQSGEGFAYRKEWNPSVRYVVNDAVTYSGALWGATKPSQGVEPNINSDTWKIIMMLKATKYPIQDTEPKGQTAGDLWFNTQNNPTEYYHLVPLNNIPTPDQIMSGKEVYDDVGNLIVGTGSVGDIEWNSDISTLNWD